MSRVFDPRPLALARADEWARCALAMVRRRYPHKLDHTILREGDQPSPEDIHPVFCGCYDWHSSVHMHWSLLRLQALAPGSAWHDEVRAQFEAHFTADQVGRERRYAAEPGRASFERPYGWAWLLKLQAELTSRAQAMPSDRALARWRDALQPLAEDIAARLADFVGRCRYPARTGLHPNSAFALLLARDHALACANPSLREAVDAAALRWFGADRAYPAVYEPGGTDFLSPGLCEALLMQRVLGPGFAAWWARFVPSEEALSSWLQPAIVSDRLDPQLVHLDGLNLSRAWCLAALAPAVPPGLATAFAQAARAHWEAAVPHVAQGDFAATHWLVSFALLAVDAVSA